MPDYIAEADEKFYFETYGSEEELTEDNYVVPQEEDYVSDEEVFYEESEVEEVDLSVAKPGLWENIRKKKERIKRGSREKMRKKGDKGAPTSDQMRRAKGDV